MPQQGRVRVKHLVGALAEVLVFNELLPPSTQKQRADNRGAPPAPLRPIAFVTERARNGAQVVTFIDFAGGHPELMDLLGAVGFFQNWNQLCWTPERWRQAAFPIRLQGCDPRVWINQVLAAYTSPGPNCPYRRPDVDAGQLEAEIVVRAQELLQQIFEKICAHVIDVTSAQFPLTIHRLHKLYNFQPTFPNCPYVPWELPAYSCYKAEKACKDTTFCMKLGCERCNVHRCSKCIFLPMTGMCGTGEDGLQMKIWSAFLSPTSPRGKECRAP